MHAEGLSHEAQGQTVAHEKHAASDCGRTASIAACHQRQGPNPLHNGYASEINISQDGQEGKKKLKRISDNRKAADISETPRHRRGARKKSNPS